jgi:HEAT repeat protein
LAPNSFKSDESFLKNIAKGAAGTIATIEKLKQCGFDPIELERGSSGFKIWKKIKIKRVRVPDIICLKSGMRFESRCKTKLEISMSHSLKDPKRSWNADMRSDDFVSLMRCEQKSDSPIDWTVVSPIHFIKIADMNKSFDANEVSITKPKGVEEGSEIRVVWPCSYAKQESFVEEMGEKTLKLRSASEGGNVQRLRIKRKSCNLQLQCNVGDVVKADQIVLSCVPVTINPTFPGEVDEDFFLERLKRFSLSERYAAAKVLRYRGYEKGENLLKERMCDPDEDIYVRLEAAAALAVYDNHSGWNFLNNSLNSEFLEVQLETIIVLSEIKKSKSEETLIQVLIDKNRDDEIRAGAAWALGEFATEKSLSALSDSFSSHGENIKIEAARALLRIAPSKRDSLVNLIKDIDINKRDGIAWTLARTGHFNPTLLLPDDITDTNMRYWASYIIGFGKDLFIEEQIKNLCDMDPEIRFAASVLWQILSSWIYRLEEY